MKQRGRPIKPLSTTDIAMCKEWVEGNQSYDEVAEKYNVPVGTLKYKVIKYRKKIKEEKELAKQMAKKKQKSK